MSDRATNASRINRDVSFVSALIGHKARLLVGCLLLMGGLHPTATDAQSSSETPPLASSADMAREARLARGAMAKFRFTADRPVVPQINVTADGRSQPLAGFKGKVVLLNVWASWCMPCRKEMPALSQLKARLSEDRVEVVAVSIDKSDQDAMQFLAALGIHNLTLYRDPAAQSLRALGIAGVPSTLLIDADGYEVGRLNGEADWASDDAVLLIRAAASDAGRPQQAR